MLNIVHLVYYTTELSQSAVSLGYVKKSFQSLRNFNKLFHKLDLMIFRLSVQKRKQSL